VLRQDVDEPPDDAEAHEDVEDGEESPRAGSDAGSGSSRTPCPNEEEPRDTQHLPRRHRVEPPPVVRFSLAGLDRLRLPTVLGKQRLRAFR
jgi:hypothetical protein